VKSLFTHSFPEERILYMGSSWRWGVGSQKDSNLRLVVWDKGGCDRNRLGKVYADSLKLRKRHHDVEK
jgi:hypothetical protein